MGSGQSEFEVDCGVCNIVECAGGSLNFSYNSVQCSVEYSVFMQYVVQCITVKCSVFFSAV